jgi:hypothetical protein
MLPSGSPLIYQPAQQLCIPGFVQSAHTPSRTFYRAGDDARVFEVLKLKARKVPHLKSLACTHIDLCLGEKCEDRRLPGDK